MMVGLEAIGLAKFEFYVSVPTRHLNPLSKTNLAAIILFHAKLLEFGDRASKKDVLEKYFDL